MVGRRGRASLLDRVRDTLETETQDPLALPVVPPRRTRVRRRSRRKRRRLDLGGRTSCGWVIYARRRIQAESPGSVFLRKASFMGSERIPETRPPLWVARILRSRAPSGQVPMRAIHSWPLRSVLAGAVSSTDVQTLDFAVWACVRVPHTQNLGVIALSGSAFQAIQQAMRRIHRALRFGSALV